jgi:hypothetical protein
MISPEPTQPVGDDRTGVYRAQPRYARAKLVNAEGPRLPPPLLHSAAKAESESSSDGQCAGSSLTRGRGRRSLADKPDNQLFEYSSMINRKIRGIINISTGKPETSASRL